MSNNMGAQSSSVYWTGYEIHNCLKVGATKISCVLDNGDNSYRFQKSIEKPQNPNENKGFLRRFM